MPQTFTRLAAVALSVTLTAGCATSVPKGPKTSTLDSSAPTIASTSVSRVTTLTGIAQAPARLIANNAGGLIANNSGGLIANNSGGLIANNSGGLIANNAGGYRLLDASEQAPLAQAKVVMVDQFHRSVKGVATVTTDEKGKFTIKNVPVNNNWIIEIQTDNVRLATMVRPAPAPLPLSVTPATTLVTEHLRQAFSDQRAALTQVAPEHFTFLAQKVDAQLKKDDSMLDLRNPSAAAGSFAHVASVNKEIAQEGKEIINDVATATRLAISKGQLKADEMNGPRVDPTAAELALAAYAGTGVSGFTDNDAPGNAQFAFPAALAFDQFGTLYVADMANYRIRKIQPSGKVSTHSGLAEKGVADGEDTQATFGEIQGLAVDKQSNLYVADTSNNLIRKVFPDGSVITLAGMPNPGLADGKGGSARFNQPRGIAVTSDGSVYVADTGNHAIRMIAPDGTVSTIAGKGTSGSVDGAFASARFNMPVALAFNGAGALFVADMQNSRIRKIDLKAKTVATFAGGTVSGFKDEPGTRALFNGPAGLLFDAVDNLYVADSGNNRIRKITPDGQVTTLAGSGETGKKDGGPLAGSFDEPRGMTFDPEGALYIADYRNHLIRRLAPR